MNKPRTEPRDYHDGILTYQAIRDNNFREPVRPFGRREYGICSNTIFESVNNG